MPFCLRGVELTGSGGGSGPPQIRPPPEAPFPVRATGGRLGGPGPIGRRCHQECDTGVTPPRARSNLGAARLHGSGLRAGRGGAAVRPPAGGAPRTPRSSPPPLPAPSLPGPRRAAEGRLPAAAESPPTGNIPGRPSLRPPSLSPPSRRSPPGPDFLPAGRWEPRRSPGAAGGVGGAAGSLGPFRLRLSNSRPRRRRRRLGSRLAHRACGTRGR